MSKDKTLISEDGEVDELGSAFFAKATRGRPALLPRERKVRRNFMLDPDIVEMLNGVENKSAFVNDVLRKALGRS